MSTSGECKKKIVIHKAYEHNFSTFWSIQLKYMHSGLPSAPFLILMIEEL